MPHRRIMLFTRVLLLAALLLTSSTASIIQDEEVGRPAEGEKEIDRPAGMYVQVSQDGLDYITGIAQRILPAILRNMTIPPTKIADGTMLKSFKVDRFDAPNMSARFVAGEGVLIHVHLPSVRMTGRYSASLMSWWTTNGAIRAEVKELNLDVMLLTVFNRTMERAEITVPLCSGSTSHVEIVFGGDFSAPLNMVRTLVGEYLTNELDAILCQLAVTTARLMAEQIAEPRRVYDGGVKGEEEDAPLLSTSHLCGAARMGLDGEHSLTDGKFAIDFDLVDDVKVFDTYSLAAFDATMTYEGLAPSNVHRNVLEVVPVGRRMVTFVVTEYTANTFFAHVFEHHLGRTERAMRVASFPRLIRKAVETFCFGCELSLVADLTSAPVVTISSGQGVKLYFEGIARIIFDGPFRRFDLVNANVGLTVMVRPYVRAGALYGKVDLNNIDVRVERLGIGGVVGDTIGGVLKKIIPKQIWPSVKRRLRFALDRKGIKLPVMCGLELRSTSLRYVEHAIVVDTDIELDVDAFVGSFISANKAM